MSDLISREIVLMFLREWTYCSDVEDLVITLNAEPVQAQIDAARRAERQQCAERFANHDCIRMKEYVYGWRHVVYDAIRKGDQP